MRFILEGTELAGTNGAHVVQIVIRWNLEVLSDPVGLYLKCAYRGLAGLVVSVDLLDLSDF